MEELFLLVYSSAFLKERRCSTPDQSYKFMQAELYFSDLSVIEIISKIL